VSDLEQLLAEIEDALDSNTYTRGRWDVFLERAALASPDELVPLESSITRVSEKLHQRTSPSTMPFERALAFEILASLGGFAILTVAASTGSTVGFVAATVCLVVTLQPLLKVATGLAFRLAFGYAYLWGVEPRFKLKYGTYLAAPRWKRVSYHVSGMLGSPFAWLIVAVVARPSHPTLSGVLWWLAVVHMVFIVGQFLLAVAGVRRVPLIGLLRLGSGGAAGWELRHRSRASRGLTGG
jgi:hypothetical protein